MPPLTPLNTVDLLLCICAAYLLIRIAYLKVRPRKPLPPGPKRLPLIGNLLDLPKGPEGLHWAKHKALYGSISSVEVFGLTMIIVNDRDIAIDLLDKRSAIYSCRPILTFGGELVGFDKVTTFLRYGDTFKLHRKLLRNFIGTRAALRKHEELEEVETRRFLFRLLNDPEDFMGHIRALPGAIILKMSHGYTVNPNGHDPLVELADRAVGTIFAEACQAGSWIVDSVPILKYLPEWVPGAGFKRTAREWRQTVSDFYDKPFAFVKHQMDHGIAKPSFTSEYLEKKIADENDTKYIASTLYGGGADTTASSLGTFFLSMALFPGVLRRAQEEIDRIIGSDRLPSFEDRESLPYINALCKELFRWENVAPSGLLYEPRPPSKYTEPSPHAGGPHVTIEEDEYMGFRIPTGAVVLPITWQMTHDEDVYSDPFAFKPERFLEENGHIPEPDPRGVAFGFGRRICPGKEFAESTMFITAAMVVATFNVAKAKDANGREIEPVHEFTAGTISHPKPFECSITPRSGNSVALIESIIDDHPFEKGDGDILTNLS